MNYADAGVSLSRADEAMQGVKKSVRSTFNEGVLGDVGNFGGLYTLKHLGMKEPVLVSSVDGVGTKLKIDIEMETHDLPGQDIVNHCCNDILVQGARPLFFLDYVATGRLDPGVMDSLVAGMSKACRENGLVLIGGETAEMPGFYGPGDYDISGTIVGVVERENIIDGKKIKPGTIILGLPSTGLHTNGYSLARKALFEVGEYELDSRVDGMEQTIGEALAVPHRSYYKSLIDLCDRKLLQGLVHITGSGYQGNIPRILPEDVDVVIDREAWVPPMIFRLIQEAGSVEENEMYSTFNMGIGMLLFVDPADRAEVEAHLKVRGEAFYEVGSVVPGTRQVKFKDEL